MSLKAGALYKINDFDIEIKSAWNFCTNWQAESAEEQYYTSIPSIARSYVKFRHLQFYVCFH